MGRTFRPAALRACIGVLCLHFGPGTSAAAAPQQLPATSQTVTEWTLGTPDAVLTSPLVSIPARTTRTRLNVALDVPFERTRFVRAWEILSSNSKVIRLGTLVVDVSGVPTVFDVGTDDEEALLVSAATSTNSLFFDWVPGDKPGLAADGAAWPVGPSTPPVLHLDLVPGDADETVSVSIALYFSETAPVRMPAVVRLTRQDLEIPAGSTTFAATDTFQLPVDVDVEAVDAHARALARQVEVTAQTPDNAEVTLLSVKDWDEASLDHRSTRAVRLPAGSIVRMNIRYDNSRANPRNPNSPPAPVRLGHRNRDEVAEVWLRVLPVQPSERAALLEAIRQHVVPQTVKGRSLMVRDEPRSVELREALAMALVDSGDLAGAEREFRVAQSLRPNAASARFNIGMAVLGQNRQLEASQWFTSALAADPQHGPSHLQLGLQRQAAGDLAGAASHLDQAVELRSQDPNVLLAAGVIDALTGRSKRATARMRHALELRPDWANAEAALALALSSGPSPTLEERNEAVALAERAVQRTQRRIGAFLDILAGALDANGERARAIAAAREALSLAEQAGDRAAAETMRARISEWETAGR